MTTLLQNAETLAVLRPVEADLLRTTGGTAIQWYGRAATALYYAYKVAAKLSANIDAPEVILPSISCATPANAAVLAGMTPRFAEVDAASGMPTLEQVQQRCTAQTRAVVFIHLFGQTPDLRALAAWCRAKGIVLIEDLAQALGALLPDGTPAGSAGDLSIYSFNATKILECGGGALLIRSAELAQAYAELTEADPLPIEVEESEAKILSLSYRNLHHSLVALRRIRAVDDISKPFLQLQPGFRSLYLRRMKHPEALATAWGSLRQVLQHRQQNAREYEALLSNGNWERLSQWQESGVCWRYSLLVNFPEKLVSFSDAVRRNGYHVSNLYWPVNEFFRPSDHCPNAERFARRVVNLWVDSSVDRQWVRRCAETVRGCADQFAV
ncbi:MAG TPA: DegT/DnrJ/EryC1/StrS family aminotransferase [Candidatus Sulfotelmatobacter sp.]|jgi:dTDP-4-amino-4,6-dideoxygalactose transaminase